jgi:hypothetical protein
VVDKETTVTASGASHKMDKPKADGKPPSRRGPTLAV